MRVIPVIFVLLMASVLSGYPLKAKLNVAGCSSSCLRKCCEMRHVLLKAECTYKDTNTTVDQFLRLLTNRSAVNSSVEFGLMHCPAGQYLMEPDVDDVDEFTVEDDNYLLMVNSNTRVSPEEYCLEEDGDGLRVAVVCFPAEKRNSPNLVNAIGMIISIPFLVATLVIYSILPDKRNISTRCQMCYVLSLTSAYFFLVFIQLATSLESTPCIILASICHYSFMSSFCWMNISCIDIYWTFSGRGGYVHGFIKKSAQMKKFSFYCIYAYGFPLALVSLILGVNSLSEKSLWYHPNFGLHQCWIREGLPLLIYFYGPMGLLVVANITLFVLTALQIRQLEREASMVRRDESRKHYENDKQRFVVYFKLLIALGINWSLEFLSWLVDWQLKDKKIEEIWYLPDLCNALYGVLIFYLFVCKRTIYILLKKRYYVFMGQPQKAHALSTRTSNYQTTDTEKTNVDETVNSTKV